MEKHPALSSLLSCLGGAEKLRRQRASHGVPQELGERRKVWAHGTRWRTLCRQPRTWAAGSKRGVGIRGKARTEEPRDAGREPQRAGVWLVLGRKGGKQGREGGWGEERRVHWF